MDVKSKYQKIFKDCISIMEKYDIDTTFIKQDLNQIPNFRVTTPIIGGFSTGKSSMINAILGKKLLSVNITPETSIPTEIFYGDNNVTLINGDNKKSVDIDEFKEIDLSINDVDLIKIQYENEFLKKIKDVVIVDMPGFDSGIELHNKAIDKYLPKSLAYIITFSADDPTVKESIVNFLKELKLYDMPVYIVITKCDKVTENQLQNEIKLHIKKSVENLLNINNVKIACVKSKKDRNTNEVEEFLLEIQQKSDEIFEKEYSNKIRKYISEIETYINNRLKKNDFSIEQLEEEQKDLENKLQKTQQKLSRERQNFDGQLQKCIEAIRRKIEADLSASSSFMETAILNGNDISDKVNMIVRKAVTTGIKTEFEPKLQKYLRHVADIIDVNTLVDTTVEVNQVEVATENMVKDIVLKAIPVVIATIGGVLAGPIGAVIGGALSVIVETIFGQKQEERKRSLARQKVQEAIPQISSQAIEQVEKELRLYVQEINTEIEADLNKKIEITNKAIEDIKIEKRNKKTDKEQTVAELKADLKEVGDILNEIR
ncbi:MAG: dynamin family protein [Intestinibacter sp.]|uniref:dynamin family protein n=2 Tax=Intestinibacter sp. TaxID=1965304 RepID=UPI002A7F8D1C|nr:dynamin family protein [Intestinibacter sp.]MDY4573500.1 dynamin family protein [Intestinibacter sp.]